MASTKTSGGSRKGQPKKGSPGRPKGSGSRSSSKQQQTEKRQRQLAATLLFVFGALFSAIALIPGQNLWNGIHQMLFGMMGWCACLAGPVCIYIAVVLSFDKPNQRPALKSIQLTVLLFLLCAATQIFGAGMPDDPGFLDKLLTVYESGKALEGGGLLGAILGLPLLTMGKLPAAIVIVLLVLLFFMLFTGTTIADVMRGAYRPVKKIGQAYNARVEENRQLRQQRQELQEIDIPVDDMPDEGGAKELSRDTDAPSGTKEGDELLRSAKDKLLRAAGAKPSRSRTKEEKPPVFPDYPPAAPPAQSVDSQPFLDLPAAPPVSADPDDEDLSAVWSSDYTGRTSLSTAAAPAPSPTAAGRTAVPADSAGGEALSQGRFHMVKPIEPAADDPFTMPQTAPFLSELPKDGVTDAAQSEESAQINDLISRAISDSPKKTELDQSEAVITPVSAATEDGRFHMVAQEPEPPAPSYIFPEFDLLQEAKPASEEDVSAELRANADKLVDTLKSFGVQTRVVDISRGPAVTRYELQPSAGVKISKITGLADDIALNLAAGGVRIEAPIPNKPAVGIEVPNRNVSIVSIREILDSNEFANAKSRLAVALGRDIAGNITLADIAKMPHVLIAGATGSGKSVCINSIIISLLYKSSPEDVRLLMVDPKVVELGIYNGIPHLLVPVVTDPKKAAGALNWAVTEMLNRYKLFADNGVRDLKGYNAMAADKEGVAKLPEIVIIIDELADLMMAAPNDVEDAICRLAQMARAAGMHLVIATQRPSVDVITGVIKANIPSRIAFAVSSQVDSRTILDGGGAEKLLGRGDMLFYPVGAAKPIRVQGCFVSDKEVENVVGFIKANIHTDYDQDVMEEIERRSVSDKSEKGDKGEGGGLEEDDEMLSAAIEWVVEGGQASVSMLQRRLKLGYARAARLIDEMEARGIVGPYEGSKPRQVLITRQQWMEMKLGGE